jgi:hypothetical protein
MNRKLIKIILLIVFSVLISFSWGLVEYVLIYFADNGYSSDELKVLKEKLPAYEVMDKVADRMAKKYRLLVVGDISFTSEKVVKEVGLVFHVHRFLTQEQVREILVECTEECLREVNSNKEIRPYLQTYPFTTVDVRIGLMIFPQGKSVYNSDTEASFVADGKLVYTTNKGTECEESFEEAKALVKQSKKDKHQS